MNIIGADEARTASYKQFHVFYLCYLATSLPACFRCSFNPALQDGISRPNNCGRGNGSRTLFSGRLAGVGNRSDVTGTSSISSPARQNISLAKLNQVVGSELVT